MAFLHPAHQHQHPHPRFRADRSAAPQHDRRSTALRCRGAGSPRCERGCPPDGWTNHQRGRAARKGTEAETLHPRPRQALPFVRAWAPSGQALGAAGLLGTRIAFGRPAPTHLKPTCNSSTLAKRRPYSVRDPGGQSRHDRPAGRTDESSRHPEAGSRAPGREAPLLHRSLSHFHQHL
jgi:hypothetical protein